MSQVACLASFFWLFEPHQNCKGFCYKSIHTTNCHGETTYPFGSYLAKWRFEDLGVLVKKLHVLNSDYNCHQFPKSNKWPFWSCFP
jgi:hypothetical protein